MSKNAKNNTNATNTPVQPKPTAPKPTTPKPNDNETVKPVQPKTVTSQNTIYTDEPVLGKQDVVIRQPKKTCLIKPEIYGPIHLIVTEEKITAFLKEALKDIDYIKKDVNGNPIISSRVTTGMEITNIIISNSTEGSPELFALRNEKGVKERKFQNIMVKTGGHIPLNANKTINLTTPTEMLCIEIDTKKLVENTPTILQGVDTIGTIDIRKVYNDLMDIIIEPSKDGLEGFSFSQNGLGNGSGELLALNIFKIIRDNMVMNFGEHNTIQEISTKMSDNGEQFAVLAALVKK